MKKTLIYLEKEALAPRGGPYAVGYFLQEALKKMNASNIDFIGTDLSLHNKLKTSSLGKSKLCLKIFRMMRNYRRYSNVINGDGYLKADLSEYEIVHFHKTSDMYAAREALKDYQGTVILTSHSPVPLSQEIYDGLSAIEKKIFKGLYSKLGKIDEYAFRRADIIHFPCPEAEESYMKNMPAYGAIKQEKVDSFYYLPTGIIPCTPKRERQAVRASLSISNSDFVMCYVGRHNEVKGYGKLKEMGHKLLNEDDNSWMVVAGKEEPMKRYEHKHWIEVGFTDDAYSFINASDVFILPNTETYFDIVMLEILSLGKIVVASRTGGNKFFDGKSEGIFLYDTLEEAVQIVHGIKSMPVEKRMEIGQKNKKLFDENFTNEVYAKRYISFLETL